MKVDNAFVRITETIEASGATQEISARPVDRLLVSVGPGKVSVTPPGKHSVRQLWDPGHVQWIPAGQFLVCKNAGSAPVRIVEIELKGSKAGPWNLNPDLDPIAIDPEHNVLLLNNDQVRVFRSWREPGATEKMHEHAGIGRVAVLMSSLDATVKVADGPVTALHAALGDVLWSGPVIHATTNLGSEKFEMVIVEVK